MLFPSSCSLGLRFGIFTPSEIGAFAVVVRGRHRRPRLPQARPRQVSANALEGSLVDVGSVMFLLALSAIFGYGIVFERVPEAISAWMLGLTDSPHVVMVLIVTFILLAGTFMEGSVLIIMLTPIFLPLVTQYGIDPVHFGLVFIIAATIGNFTPPVGAAMFVVCQILRCPIGDLHARVAAVPARRLRRVAAADLRAGGGAVAAGLDLREGFVVRFTSFSRMSAAGQAERASSTSPDKLPAAAKRTNAGCGRP